MDHFIECSFCHKKWDGMAQCDCWMDISDSESSSSELQSMDYSEKLNDVLRTKRKYRYPPEYLTIRNKIHKKKRNLSKQWRQDIQTNQTNHLYLEKLKLENHELKKKIQDYKSALETWILIAQSK